MGAGQPAFRVRGIPGRRLNSIDSRRDGIATMNSRRSGPSGSVLHSRFLNACNRGPWVCQASSTWRFSRVWTAAMRPHVSRSGNLFLQPKATCARTAAFLVAPKVAAILGIRLLQISAFSRPDTARRAESPGLETELDRRSRRARGREFGPPSEPLPPERRLLPGTARRSCSRSAPSCRLIRAVPTQPRRPGRLQSSRPPFGGVALYASPYLLDWGGSTVTSLHPL